MNTKIKVTIKNDYDSSLAYDIRNENIRYLLTQLNLYCEVGDIQTKTTYDYKSDDTDELIVNATGYNKGDWQKHILDYNEKETNKDYLKQLANLLVMQLNISYITMKRKQFLKTLT